MAACWQHRPALSRPRAADPTPPPHQSEGHPPHILLRQDAAGAQQHCHKHRCKPNTPNGLRRDRHTAQMGCRAAVLLLWLSTYKPYAAGTLRGRYSCSNVKVYAILIALCEHKLRKKTSAERSSAAPGPGGMKLEAALQCHLVPTIREYCVARCRGSCT